LKRLWIASALLLFLLSSTLFNAYFSQSLADNLSEQLTQAQQMAQNGQWGSARALTRLAYHRWQDNHFYLHTVMRHSDTDQILRSFQGVLQYLSIREWDQYTAANADLITQIQLLAEMEQASLVNVL